MNILFISKNQLAGNLAYLLKKEGHEVRLFVQDKQGRSCFDNMVTKSVNWRKDLSWVGKKGFIIFDDSGYGKIQDKLRKQGYAVVGGCELADKLELDREYGQRIFAQYGMKTVSLKDFENMDDAVIYAKKNPKKWVIKQNNNGTKILNYIGMLPDGRDVISVLKNYLQNKSINIERITLHEKIDGVEIGVGRYFNGNDWVGPIEFNVEHTRFFPGDIGPTTSEMGTLAWYSNDNKNKLYREALEILTPYLKKIGFKGDMEVNCIVNEKGLYPLEATPRFGTPIVHLQSELNISPWGEFLDSVARGKHYELKWKEGYGIVVLVAIPPFPYNKKNKENLFYGVNIYLDKLSKEDMKHVHFEEVSLRIGSNNQYYISDSHGYVLYVTGVGQTIEEAQKKTYAIIDKIIVPKMLYRNDIGSSFINESKAKLEKWGYL